MRLQGTWLTPAPVASQNSTENNRAVKLFELELYERVPFGLVAEWQTVCPKLSLFLKSLQNRGHSFHNSPSS